MGTNGMNLEVNAVRAARSSSAAGLSAEPAPASAPAHILPVDPGFSIESHMYMRQVKGEDIAFSYRADSSLLGRPMPSTQTGTPEEWKLNFDVFVLCDGHSGSQANMFVRQEFLRLMEPQMPRALPASFSHTAGAVYASTVRTAVSNTLDALNERFCEAYERSGCTCTVAVYTGALLTVANIGDSDAVLDAFSEMITMTVAHRINDNEAEKSRLMATGAEIAPLSQEMDGPAPVGTLGLGPLRIWPGGLCVSRSIGDKDVGPNIIGTPHIRQVLVPSWGCRLIMASDGVWDCISKSVVVSTCKGKACGAAATNIVNKCVRVRQGALADDTTCVVIDSKPHNVATFKGYAPDLTKKEGSTTSVKGATGPVLPGETSMDAYADGAPNQISAPLKNAASPTGAQADSANGLYMPSSSTESSPKKGMAQNASMESLTGAGNKLSTIVSNVSSAGADDGVYATALSTVGEAESAPRKTGNGNGNGTTQATYIAGKASGGAADPEDVQLQQPQAVKRKSKSGIFSCCFTPGDTEDGDEKLRMSMLNDHTHHAGTINDVPKGAAVQGLTRADTSHTSLGASSDTQHGVPKATDPSTHSGISEGSRSGAGMRTIASVAGSLNFLRRKRSAAPLVTLFADLDMLASPKAEDLQGGPGAPGGLNAPAGSLILRSTSTADDAAQTGAHSPDTPLSGNATPGVSLTGSTNGNAPEGRLRGGRARHQFSASQHQRSSSGAASSPGVFLPQASEMSVAGSAWGTPVQVTHSQGHSAHPVGRRKNSVSVSEAGNNTLDSPETAGVFGMAFRASNGEASHSARSGDGMSAQSVPSTAGLPTVPKRQGSPELDMGIMPPASPVVRNQLDARAHRRVGSSGGPGQLMWRGQSSEMSSTPATGKTVGDDGGV